MEERKLIKIKNEVKEMTCGEVYEQFKRMIYKIAISYGNSTESLDDLVQIGSIGLIKAFNAYNLESGCVFITLLATVVNNEFRMKLRKEKRATNEISFDDYIAIDSNGNALTLLGLIKEPTNCEEMALKNIRNIELTNYISELTPRNRNIIESFYFENTSQIKIGEKFNISQSYVARLIKKSLGILKNKYERDECLMTKKEECYEIFNDNQGATREQVINLVIKNVGVTKTTAQTYYPTWRKELMDRSGYAKPAKNGKQENIKNITKNNDFITQKPSSITEMTNKVTKACEVFPVNTVVIPKTKPTFNEIKKEIKDVKVGGINWKVDAIIPDKILIENGKEGILEITRLIPLVMKGKHGRYFFDEDGVKATLKDEFISKDKMEEALEALKVWEKSYGKEGVPAC